MHIEIGKQLVPTVPVLLSDFFKYRPSGEANSCIAFRDIYFLSWSQKNSPLFCVLHQINPVNTIPFSLFKMQFFDLLLSTLTVSCISYIVSICQPLFISTAPNIHRIINYTVAKWTYVTYAQRRPITINQRSIHSRRNCETRRSARTHEAE